MNVDISFLDNDIDLLLTIINTLRLVKVAVDALCRRVANLLTAVTTFFLMLDNLKKQSSELSSQLRNSLLQQIQYLYHGRLEGNKYFSSLSRNCISKIISNSITRLTLEETLTISDSDSSFSVTQEEMPRNLILEKQLNLNINEKLSSVNVLKKMYLVTNH